MGGTQLQRHPLDPLSAPEIEAVATAVRAHSEFSTLSADTRFITMELAEPDKAELRAWSDGGRRPPRVAEVVMLDRGSEASVEATVSLDAGTVTGWRIRTDIQPMVVVGELMEAEDLVRDDPRFQAAWPNAGSRISRRCRSMPGRPGTLAMMARTASGWVARSRSCGPTPVIASGRIRWTG